MFYELFTESNRELKSLRDNRGLTKEIKRLKAILNQSSPKEQKDIQSAIDYLKGKL